MQKIQSDSILTDDFIKSLYDYEGDYEPGKILINFYSKLKNEILQIDYKVDIDARKIKISEELYLELTDKVTEEAEKAGYPKKPSPDEPISTAQGVLMWMNQGPSIDKDLSKYTVIVEEGAFVKTKEEEKAVG